MPSRVDFERLNAQIAEAAAQCENARQHFEHLREELRKAIDQGRFNARAAAREEKARKQLHDARVRLAELRHRQPH